jgi:transposase
MPAGSPPTGSVAPCCPSRVKVAGKLYIVCRNEAVAAEEAETRRKVVAALDEQLKRGDKAMIGNSAYRRFLRPVTEGKPGRKRRLFEIDAGKLAEEARFDGVFVLRSNARISPLQAVLRYRDLQNVERLFRLAKATMRTRPIYHSSDAAICGHVFCSFLALILHQALDKKLRRAGKRVEWADLLRDLDRLQQVTISKGGQDMVLRTPATGSTGTVFKAAGVALPANVRDAPAP